MSVEGILRAMVRNYAKGNLWDHLDAKACAEAADLIEKQAAELEAAMAEIARLENQVQARDAELWGRTQKILQLEQQLAAEQAKNVGLREALENHSGNYKLPKEECTKINALLDAPSDTSALEAIVKKAGEVMREKCATYVARNLYSNQTDLDAIRTLPAVTLEDLK